MGKRVKQAQKDLEKISSDTSQCFLTIKMALLSLENHNALVFECDSEIAKRIAELKKTGVAYEFLEQYVEKDGETRKLWEQRNQQAKSCLKKKAEFLKAVATLQSAEGVEPSSYT